MSDDTYMKRGKSQVLFNYLPNNTFDYTGKNGIHKVERIDAVTHTGTDEGYLIQQVRNRVSAWEGASGYGAIGYPKYDDGYQIVKPREVKTTLFPLLFRCTTCERIHTYESTDELDRYNRQMECNHSGCSGRIQQHQFVFIHSCGSIRTPNPYKCNKCGSWDDWTFESYGSQRFRNAEWRCLNCSNTKDIGARCDCDLDDDWMVPTVHRASSAYQPQHISVIDIGSDLETDPKRPSFSQAVVAKYLGLTDEPIGDIELEQENTSEERRQIEWQLKQYREMYEDSGAPQLEEKIEELEEELEEMGDATGPLGEQVLQYVPTLRLSEEEDEPPKSTQEGVFDAYQYHSVEEQLNRTPAAEVIINAGEDTPQSRKRREERAANLGSDLTKMGIDEVAFIENFPITNAVFGYTRIDNDPDNSRLSSFPSSAVNTSGDGTPIFADTVETEAVQFSMNPERVFTWLLENSRLEEPPSTSLREAIADSDLPTDREIPRPDHWDIEVVDEWLAGTGVDVSQTEPQSDWSEADIRAWLLTNVGEVPELEAMPIDAEGEEMIAYMVYHLVHSYSHLALKQVAQLSGMSRTSMAEYLLPRALSFVIYSNQRTDFNIGGMYTLVESSLDDLLSGIDQRGNDCVYDPVCSREGASCHSCLYISEVSCTHLNRNLGRDFVYGSKSLSERGIRGYLDVAMDDD